MCPTYRRARLAKERGLSSKHCPRQGREGCLRPPQQGKMLGAQHQQGWYLQFCSNAGMAERHGAGLPMQC